MAYDRLRSLVGALAVALAACGDRSAPAPKAAGGERPALEATWRLGGEPAPERVAVAWPMKEPLHLAIRLTNRGPAPVQVVRSSVPSYRFFRLEVRREGDAAILPVYFDVYPTKDRSPPAKEFVTLAPGAWIEREVDLLLREGYALETFAAAPLRGHFENLRARGFGAMREPATYEVVGLYSTTPLSLGLSVEPLFEGETGRDPAIALADAVVRTPVLRIAVAR